jgi:medium-chain acyl-[acyl-carrier-protein] hydrolase
VSAEIKKPDVIRLFCLPYAGGSSSTYLGWKKWLDPRIELKPVELAGRRGRLSDPHYLNAAEAVDDIYSRIVTDANNCIYAMFGHSMGTILVYELLRKMQAAGMPEPAHVFFSGRFPPFVKKKRTKLHALCDIDFIRHLHEYGSAAEELLSNKAVMAHILPVLRNDYKIVETYRHGPNKLMLGCNITVLHGKLDPLVSRTEAGRWRECTTGSCAFNEINDGHFFVNRHRQEIISLINATLVNDKEI